MYQLVYRSMANREFSFDDLKKLLVRARMRNKVLGVTGMLVFHDGSFLQALEGEKRAVNEIFGRILNDARHRDLTILHQGAGPDARVFGDWSMGFADFTGAADILKGFVRLNAPLQLGDLDGKRAVELLSACSADEILRRA